MITALEFITKVFDRCADRPIFTPEQIQLVEEIFQIEKVHDLVLAELDLTELRDTVRNINRWKTLQKELPLINTALELLEPIPINSTAEVFV